MSASLPPDDTRGDPHASARETARHNLHARARDTTHGEPPGDAPSEPPGGDPRGATPSPGVELGLSRTLAALERFGLLLFSDPALPSLVGMIVDAPLRTSWWGHPRGPIIYATMNRVDDDPHVLSAKLIAGKVTYVHQRLWPALVSVASAAEDWQLDGLSPAARWLLSEVTANEELQTDSILLPPEARGGKRVADLARELERRLLVHATQVHTPSGAHARVLQSWARWAADIDLPPATLSPPQARAALEASAARLAADVEGGVVELPWRPRPRRGGRRALT